VTSVCARACEDSTCLSTYGTVLSFFNGCNISDHRKAETSNPGHVKKSNTQPCRVNPQRKRTQRRRIGSGRAANQVRHSTDNQFIVTSVRPQAGHDSGPTLRSIWQPCGCDYFCFLLSLEVLPFPPSVRRHSWNFWIEQAA
jgi:hypothetical protein